VVRACTSQPPSSSAVISSLSATEVTFGLDTDIEAPLRMIATSDCTAYQVPMP